MQKPVLRRLPDSATRCASGEGLNLLFFDYTRNSEHVTFKHHAQRAEVTSTRCSLHATAYEKNLQQHLLRRLIFLLNGPGL